MLINKSKSGATRQAVTLTTSFTNPWTKEELAVLARGFIDEDLDGSDLHKWCKRQGINRTPGAIDKKLHDLNFFDDTPIAKPSTKRNGVPIDCQEQFRAKVAEQARRNLQNQIRLAKLELDADIARPFKSGPLEF